MKRPSRNLFSLLSGDLGSRLIGFGISVYLARVLEPAGFGLVSLGLSVLGYLQLAGSPGIQLLETRNTAARVDVDRARVGAVMSLRLVLAAVLWSLTTWCVLHFVPQVVTGHVIVLFALALFPLALTLDWFFQGKEDFPAVVISRLLQFVAYGIVVLLLVHGIDDVTGAAVAYVSGTVVAASALGMIYMRRWGPIRPSWAPGMWKDILVQGGPVGAAVFLAQSATNLPPLAIGYFATAAEVGLFSSAMKLVFFLLIIDRLFNALFLPVVTRYFSQRPGDVNLLVGTALRVVLTLVIPCTVVGILLGGTAMTAFFGGGYEAGASSLEILMAYFAITVLNSVFVCTLLGSGREREYTRNLVRGSIVLCVAVTVGAAWFGSPGAAYGVVLGEMVTVVLMVKEAVHVVSIPLAGILLRPLGAGVCMVASALALRGAGVVPLIALSLVVFAAGQILLKGITIKEIQFLRERFV